MQAELQSADLKERYRTRLLYAISDAEKAAAAEELDDACLLDAEWADLVGTAEAVNTKLDSVKRKFSQITRQQVWLWCLRYQTVARIAGVGSRSACRVATLGTVLR